MALLDELINLTGNLSAQHLQNEANRKQAEQQFNYDKDLASIQNNYNLDMWQKQNEYNSPKAQMQRLKDAGLSPYLAYGSVSTGNASSAPSMVVAGRKAPDKSIKWAQNFNIMSSVMELLDYQQTLQYKKQKNREIELKNDTLYNKLENSVAQNVGRVLSLGGSGDQYTFNSPLMRKYSTYDQQGLRTYYKHFYERTLQKIGLGNELLKGKFQLLDYDKMLRQKQKDWFETNQMFNMINGGLKTLLSGFDLFK